MLKLCIWRLISARIRSFLFHDDGHTKRPALGVMCLAKQTP
jgi:hypothetical protein